MTVVTVRELHLYPLKSARGIAVQRARLDPTGLEWDRHWLAIRPDGAFLTQRTQPALARITPALTDRGLLLQVEGLSPLNLPFASTGDLREVRIWRDTCQALDQGDAAAAWISAALGEPARVVRSPPSAPRHADVTYCGRRSAPLSFPDGYPLLVCNQASLDALNARLPEQIPMDRFRPNLVLEGLAPFAEDRLEGLRIGAVCLKLVKPCTRCVIPATDQRTGLRRLDPLPVLRTFRFDAALRGVTFGENAILEAGIGEYLKRGARCEALEDGASLP